jgi:hypothetical protein
VYAYVLGAWVRAVEVPVAEVLVVEVPVSLIWGTFRPCRGRGRRSKGLSIKTKVIRVRKARRGLDRSGAR